MQRDLFSGDEEELALTLLDIVEPLSYPLSVLQKARRQVLASPPLGDVQAMDFGIPGYEHLVWDVSCE